MRISIVFLLFICCFLETSAQTGSRSSVNLDQVDSVLSMASRAIGLNSPIYTGNEYIGYNPAIKGHAFFATEELTRGKIFYDGVLYYDLLLKYDIVQDEVLLFTSPGSLPIKLIKQKINHFYLGNDLFIKMVSDTADGIAASTGFYQVLHNGKVTALVKRKKQVLESRRIDEVSKFAEYITYYLKKEKVYYKFGSNRELLSLLKDKRTELQQFQKSANLNFKKDPVKTISLTTAHYSEITL